MIMKTIHRIGCFLLGLFSICLPAQNQGPNILDQNVRSAIPLELQQNAADSLFLKREHIALHLSADKLAPKDILFFTAYVFTGPNQYRMTDSETLKVELLDAKGNLVQRQRHKIENGLSYGSLKVPKKLSEGKYHIRAYTQWLLNYGPESFALENVDIVSPKKSEELGQDALDMIGAFPEGGHLVADLKQRVVVQFPSEIPNDLKVFDEKGKEVANVTPYKNGLGTFFIRPRSGSSYAIKGTGIQTLLLPEVQALGYAMQLSNLKADQLLLQVAASHELKRSTLFLSGSVGGESFFEQKLDFGEKNTLDIRIPKKSIPAGVSKLQLKDEFGQTLAERFFYHQDKTLNIRLQPMLSENNKTSYTLKVTDANGNPVESTLSVGFKVKPRGSQSHLNANWSEASIRNQRYWNDLLAVTGGSSHFLNPNRDLETPKAVKYKFQKGFDFYGQAYDLNNSLLTQKKIQVLVWTKNKVLAKEVETNLDGLFKLTDLAHEGTIKMAFRTSGDDSKTKLVHVVPYEMETPPLKDINRELQMTEKLVQKNAQKKRKGPDGNFQTMGASESVVSLNEVILEKKQDHKKLNPSVYSIKPSVVRYQDPDKPKTIPQLFLGIPGVQVANLGDLYPTINLFKATGAGPVLWVIDGLPLIQPTSLVQIMNIVNYNDIERIELLTGPQGTIYGARGAGGVIAIYTKDGNENGFIDRKEAQLQYEGYHESIDFAAYQRRKPKKSRFSTSHISTVYWNPVLKTNKAGEAIISFNAPRDADMLDIEIWGATQDGRRGTLQTSKSLESKVGI